MRIVLLGLAAVLGFGVPQAQAQSAPEPQAPAACPQPGVLSQQRLAGRTVMVCSSNRLMYEWVRVNGRTLLSEIQVTTPVETDILRESAEDRRRYRSGSYRSYRPYNCVGNLSTLADYYTDYCYEQRRQYRELEQNRHSPCYGENAYRYRRVCDRQRRGDYGRGR